MVFKANLDKGRTVLLAPNIELSTYLEGRVTKNNSLFSFQKNFKVVSLWVAIQGWLI
jgi:hypothetical protein